MREVIIDGAREGDCLPSGEFVTVVSGAYVLSNFGTLGLPAPGDYPRWPRLSIANGFQVAGQAQSSRLTWRFKGGEWRPDPRICNGQSAAMFDRSGNLQIIEPGPGVSSQGYRFIADDGRLVTGDATYYDAERDLNEFTEYTIGGMSIAIGQGHTFGGCVAVIQPASGSIEAKRADRTRKLLEPGDCTVVRVMHEADLMAVAITVPGRQIFRWLTVAEIEAYPDDVAPPVVVVPDPPIIVDPVPDPEEPMPNLPESVKAVRARFIAKYPVPGGGPNPADQAFEDRCRAWIKQLAEQLVFDLRDASWGVKNAGGGRPQSKDSIAHQDGGRLINFDMFFGTGTGSPRLADDPQGEDITGQTFMPVSPVDHIGGGPVVVPPVVTPPQPGVDLTGILARLVTLEAREQDLVVATDSLQGRIVRLENKPSGPAHGTVHVKGRTKSAGTSFLAHSHEFDIEAPIE